MYESLDLFQVSAAMARHAGARQAVVAENIANADTPGFRARALGAFADSYRGDAAQAMRSSRAGHLSADAAAGLTRPTVTDDEPSPNGNSVSLETEMLRGVEVQREHARALAIYKHALMVLRTSLGR